MNEEYLNKKNRLIERYTKKLKDYINEISTHISNDINDVLGVEYKILKSEYDEIEKLIEIKNKEYLESKKYTQLKEEISYLQSYLYLKKDLNLFDSEEKMKESQPYKDYLQRLNEISNLNLKFNNRLKKYRERKQLIVEEVKILFVDKREELLEIKRIYVSQLGTTISEIIKNYNKELFKLNKKYDLDNFDYEFPFSENEYKLRISSSLESNAFKEIEKNEINEDDDSSNNSDLDKRVVYESIDDSIN